MLSFAVLLLHVLRVLLWVFSSFRPQSKTTSAWLETLNWEIPNVRTSSFRLNSQFRIFSEQWRWATLSSIVFSIEQIKANIFSCLLRLYSARQKEERTCTGERRCRSNYSRQSCSNFYSLEKSHWVWLADCAVVRNRPEWSYFLPLCVGGHVLLWSAVMLRRYCVCMHVFYSATPVLVQILAVFSNFCVFCFA